MQTAIDCWDNAKIRVEKVRAKEAQDAAEKAVILARSEAERSRRAAAAKADAPWQDEAWQDPGKAVGDDESVHWEE